MLSFLPTCHTESLDISSNESLLILALPWETLSESSSRKGLQLSVPKPYFYIPHHECECVERLGVDEKLEVIGIVVRLV